MTTPEPYTPTDEQVREDYAYVSDDMHDFRGREAEFDRWLARHDAGVAAKAWDEGHRARWRRGPSGCQCSAWSSSECACGLYGTGELLSLGDNPYRARLSSGGEG